MLFGNTPIVSPKDKSVAATSLTGSLQGYKRGALWLVRLSQAGSVEEPLVDSAVC